MKIKTIHTLAFSAFTLANFIANAQNPIIQTKFTADPAPLVYKDTVFLYAGHDEDDAEGFKMFDWQLYTSADMVNWTDHGAVASTKSFSWAPENGAWAPQCIERNGKFYMYCPIHMNGIGVLVADSPYGPFKDPLGKPLIKNSQDDIDPTVYIDDDGQAYLYWGNPKLYYVKLNKDMVSYEGGIVSVPMTVEAFGKREGNPKRITQYEEGPWFYKRNGKYYMAFASVCCPEGIGYSMSDSPTGPWQYKGSIMDGDPRSSGNHPGVIDFKGNSYVFGFNYAIHKKVSDKHAERRSICLEKLTYNADGTIQKLPFWTEKSVAPAGTINPYERVQAETIAWSEGVKTAKGSNGVYVTDITNGDYIKIQAVDFNKGTKKFYAAVASAVGGSSIEIHIDSINGPLLGVLNIKGTATPDNWAVRECKVNKVKGRHDVYLVFKGASGQLFNFDWWMFK